MRILDFQQLKEFKIVRKRRFKSSLGILIPDWRGTGSLHEFWVKARGSFCVTRSILSLVRILFAGIG
ncbi:MAG: hypothetical protein WBP79_06450 [Candidatus Acidiferrales bacterium]